MSIDIKNQILNIIKSFNQKDLYSSSINLFNILGYKTDRTQRLDDTTYNGFKTEFDFDNILNENNALFDEWQKIELLFQLTKTELQHTSDLFDTGKIEDKNYESYLFFALELKSETYSRTKLAGITREINKLFKMPVMILFKYNHLLTFSIIDRRLHKRDDDKDVLKKVTLIKDINIKNPHKR